MTPMGATRFISGPAQPSASAAGTPRSTAMYRSRWKRSLRRSARAARDELAGDPLGRVGLLFAAVGLGNFGPPLSNRADKVFGGAVGHQLFFNDNPTQFVLEVGGRKGTSSEIDDAAVIGTRFQRAIGTRMILHVDGFAAVQQNRDKGFGIRSKLLVRF